MLLIAANVVLVASALPGLLGLDPSGSQRSFVPSPDSLTLIRIRGARGEIVLENQGAHWVLISSGTSFPVRDDRVSLFLDSVASTRVLRRVTESRAEDGRFGLSDRARELTLRSDRGSVRYTIGIVDHTLYARTAESDAIVELDSDLHFYLDQPPVFWLPLRLFPDEVTVRQVIALGFRSRSGTELDALNFEIVRDVQDRWVSSTKRQLVNPESASALLAGSVDLLVDGLAAAETAEGMEAVGTLWIRLADGRRFDVKLYRASMELLILDGPGSDPPRTSGVVQLIGVEQFSGILAPAASL